MDPAITDLVWQVTEFPALPVVFETSAGIRYTLDPDAAPYAHGGVLVVPLIDDAT